ncbi:MAG: zinc-ribbon domain-containing protein [Acidocella sp.]|uniref:zinc-ribbon domain-containing protein n=1 Tax=Acidocella sp. TaxID=50710 RepID=UPI003FD6E3F8
MSIADMQIICPNCSTSYEVPDAVFGGRPRKLRCVQCGHQWRAGPGEPAVEWTGMTPPAPAEAPAPWPVDRSEEAAPPAEPVNQFLLSPEQRFGHATEHQAPTEFERPAHTESAPEQAADGEHVEDKVLGVYPGTTADERDGFYDLVIAARNKAIEVEPEPPPPPRLPVTSPVFLGMLVVLFLFGLVLLEHRSIVDLIPASAGLFKLIGM